MVQLLFHPQAKKQKTRTTSTRLNTMTTKAIRNKKVEQQFQEWLLILSKHFFMLLIVQPSGRTTLFCDSLAFLICMAHNTRTRPNPVFENYPQWIKNHIVNNLFLFFEGYKPQRLQLSEESNLWFTLRIVCLFTRSFFHRPLHCSLGFQLDILLFFNYRSSCLSVVQLSPSVYLSSTFNHHSPLFLVGLQIVCILNDWRSALKYMWFTSFFSDMNRVDFVVGLGTSVLTWRPSVWNVPWDNSFSVPL